MTTMYTVDLKIRDKEHFIRLIRWLNRVVGSGKDNWTTSASPLKKIRRGEQPHIKIYIKNDKFNDESVIVMKLL